MLLRMLWIGWKDRFPRSAGLFFLGLLKPLQSAGSPDGGWMIQDGSIHVSAFSKIVSYVLEASLDFFTW